MLPLSTASPLCLYCLWPDSGCWAGLLAPNYFTDSRHVGGKKPTAVHTTPTVLIVTSSQLVTNSSLNPIFFSTSQIADWALLLHWPSWLPWHCFLLMLLMLLTISQLARSNLSAPATLHWPNSQPISDWDPTKSLLFSDSKNCCHWAFLQTFLSLSWNSGALPSLYQSQPGILTTFAHSHQTLSLYLSWDAPSRKGLWNIPEKGGNWVCRTAQIFPTS